VSIGDAPRQEPPAKQFRCVGCSYRASRRIAPERCPMCGASTWELEPRRPFSADGLGADMALVRESRAASTSTAAGMLHRAGTERG
jgi:hypothetical protein